MDMNIDIRLLKAFITLAETKSYRLAAEALFITQPALTKQIQALERIIEMKLFIRGRNGAKLTYIGEKIFLEAQILLKYYNHFFITASNIKKNAHNYILIGFGISSFQNVPKWIHAFSDKYPEYEVITRQIPSSTQIKMLMQGELDIAFARMPVHDSLNSIILSKERIVLAVPADVEVNSSNLNYVIETHSLLHIKPNLAPCLAEQTKMMLDHMNIFSNPVSATSDLSSLLALIAGKNGVAFVPASVRHFLPKGVKLIIPEFEQPGWDIAMVWNPKIRNEKRDLFLEMVKTIVTTP
jgi:DNA-binding transcriptional LysR family regulator